MRSIALALIASLAVGGSAYAGERAETMSSAEPHCQPLSDLKAALGSAAKFTTLTAGQFHFMAGLYVGSPITPPGGLPPGNGAVLIEGPGGSLVVWTRGAKHGPEACITPIVVDVEKRKAVYMPMPITPELLAMLREIKSGHDEHVMGTGGYDPNELHL